MKFYDFPEAQVNEGIMDKRAADVMENWPKAALKRTEVNETEAKIFFDITGLKMIKISENFLFSSNFGARKIRMG